MLFPENHAFGASLDFVSPKSGRARGEQFLRRILAPNALGSGGTWQMVVQASGHWFPQGFPKLSHWRTYMRHLGSGWWQLFSSHLPLPPVIHFILFSFSICPCSLCYCILCCAVHTVPFCLCFCCLNELCSLSAVSIILFKVLNCSAIVVFIMNVL